MTDRIEALERLQRLRESGALSEEEFAAEKAALLGRADAVAETPPAATSSTTVVAAEARRRPEWLLPAAVGAALLVFIVAAWLLLRGGGGEPADTAAVNVTAPPAEVPVQNAAAPAPEPGVRSLPAAAQLAAAFQAAFAGRATRTVDDSEISYRPGSLTWIGERAVLVSNGTNAEECHVCAGMVSVHYLEPAGEGFRVAGEWLSVATDDYGRPPEWRITSDLTGRPALRVENGGGNQGIFCNFVSYYDFRPNGPSEIARVQTGYTDEGNRGDEEGVALEGEIRNVVRGRSFEVAYAGDESFTERYELRGGGFLLVPGPTRVPQC